MSIAVTSDRDMRRARNATSTPMLSVTHPIAAPRAETPVRVRYRESGT